MSSLQVFYAVLASRLSNTTETKYLHIVGHRGIARRKRGRGQRDARTVQRPFGGRRREPAVVGVRQHRRARIDDRVTVNCGQLLLTPTVVTVTGGLARRCDGAWLVFLGICC